MARGRIAAIDELNAHPDEKHWEAFRKYLPKSGARYYKVFYPKKLERAKDLESAFAVIYDKKYTPLFRIPVYVRKGKEITGATIYFKALLNTNRDYKEWIS